MAKPLGHYTNFDVHNQSGVLSDLQEEYGSSFVNMSGRRKHFLRAVLTGLIAQVYTCRLEECRAEWVGVIQGVSSAIDEYATEEIPDVVNFSHQIAEELGLSDIEGIIKCLSEDIPLS